MGEGGPLFRIPESIYARRVSGAEGVPFGSGSDARYSLMYGWPDPALFPAEELAEAAARALLSGAAAALQYGRIRGQDALVNLVLGRLQAEEGLEVGRDEILITTGSASAIGMAARALLNERDAVLVEAPTFPGALTIFRAVGADMHSLPMDEEGIDVPGAERVIERLGARGVRPKLLYTMPTFHNPTGLTISQERRLALLEVARRYELLVIEDDAYHDLYYDDDRGPLPATLYRHGGDGQVLRTGSFSKILAPGVRLGWAVGPVELLHKMMHLKEESGTSPFAQMAAVEFARDGGLGRYITMLRGAYRARRDAMLGALGRYMPSYARWTRPMGGFFVWLTLSSDTDPRAMRDEAAGRGVDYMPGEACFAAPDAAPEGVHLRLAFSQRSPEEIEEAIRRLAEAVRASSRV